MARVFCVTADLPGIVGSTTEISRRLSVAGHEVTYCSFEGVRAVAERQGIRFEALEPDEVRKFRNDDARRGALGRLLSIGERRDAGAASLGVDGFADLLHDRCPDLLLIDGELHPHIIVALSAAIPLAVLNSFASIWRVDGLPPAHRRAIPGRGWSGSAAGMSAMWAQLRWRKRARVTGQWVRDLACDPCSLYRQLARRFGVDLRHYADFDQWLMPFTYAGVPALSLHAQEFEFPHQPPPHVTYVGPMVAAAGSIRSVEAATREKLSELYDWRRADAQHRLIYAGFGSFFTAEKSVVERLAEAVASHPNWRLVVSLGGRDADLGSRFSERAAVFDWVPQSELLHHADAAVTHGGINTLDECVLNGVPVLVYCGGETDMAGNTSRVVYHGLGIAGKATDGPEAIGSHLSRLMAPSPFTAAVATMGDAFRRYRDEGVLETAVEALLR